LEGNKGKNTGMVKALLGNKLKEHNIQSV